MFVSCSLVAQKVLVLVTEFVTLVHEMHDVTSVNLFLSRFFNTLAAPAQHEIIIKWSFLIGTRCTLKELIFFV
jgi:hypothetical protein